MVKWKNLRQRANEIGTASNSAGKKSSPSEGVAEGGGWGEEFRHARAEVRQQADKLRRFRRLGIKTSKQNNFQFLLRKIWRAGVKKLKENCFALFAEFRRAETRSGAIRAISVQKRFELRSAIATIRLGLSHDKPSRMVCDQPVRMQHASFKTSNEVECSEPVEGW
jgi:hypothetical protein